MNFKLKKPCANCPFRKVGAIDLRAGRLEDIVATLLANDRQWFMCHKTTGKGERVEDEDGEEQYIAAGTESVCMGAIAYMQKIGQPPLSSRMAFAIGIMKLEDVEALYPEIIEPLSCSS